MIDRRVLTTCSPRSLRARRSSEILEDLGPHESPYEGLFLPRSPAWWAPRNLVRPVQGLLASASAPRGPTSRLIMKLTPTNQTPTAVRCWRCRSWVRPRPCEGRPVPRSSRPVGAPGPVMPVRGLLASASPSTARPRPASRLIMTLTATNQTPDAVNLIIDGNKGGLGPGWAGSRAGTRRAVRGGCPGLGGGVWFGLVGDTRVAESGAAARPLYLVNDRSSAPAAEKAGGSVLGMMPGRRSLDMSPARPASPVRHPRRPRPA